MIATVNLIDGVWWFERDRDALPSEIQCTHLIRVPDGATWIDLVDPLRPEVPRHAMRIPLPELAAASVDASAGNLVFLAEAEISEAIRITTTIV